MKNLGNFWSTVGLLGVTLLFIGAATLVQGRSQSLSLASSLKVDIRPAQTTVRNTEHFVIHTKISNTSNEVQALQVWSCSYDQSWTSNHPRVYIYLVPCDKNLPSSIHLKPGEAYERELSVNVLLAAKELQQESLTFRLGFKPWIDPPVKSLPFIWSNAITVKVKP
jgi:hypothetical protein